jgi:hypothetical protein
MRVALVVTGGVDRSGRERVIPALLSFVERQARRHFWARRFTISEAHAVSGDSTARSCVRSAATGPSMSFTRTGRFPEG